MSINPYSGGTVQTLRSIALYREICKGVALTFKTDGYAENEKTYISGYATVENHRDHHAEENNDHKRVDQAEPMDAWVEDMEIIIPSSSLLRFNWLLDMEMAKGFTHGVEDSCVQDVIRTDCERLEHRLTFHITRYV